MKPHRHMQHVHVFAPGLLHVRVQPLVPLTPFSLHSLLFLSLEPPQSKRQRLCHRHLRSKGHAPLRFFNLNTTTKCRAVSRPTATCKGHKRERERGRAAIKAAAASLCCQLDGLSLHCVQQQLHEMRQYGQEVVLKEHRHEQLVHVFAPRTATWPSGPPSLSLPLSLSPLTLPLSLPLELPQSLKSRRLRHEHLQSQEHSPPRPFNL